MSTNKLRSLVIIAGILALKDQFTFPVMATAPTANQKVGDYAMIQVSTDGTTFTNLGIVEEITGNKIESPKVVTTKLSDQAETSQGGRPDYGTVATMLRFAASMNGTIAGYQIAKTPLLIRVVPSDITLAAITPANGTNNSYEQCQGWVKDFDPFGKLQANKEIVSSVTFQLSGSGSFFNAGA